ncbi:MAG TPA: A24 family peptidase [Candidatus Limnocylindrales bacterium]|nr:A24 family peptidase [Candidatus Limnocylindrales bacterium]
MTPLVAVLAVAGAVLGVAADRFAVRWPEHDEEHPAGRAVDWRTAATGLFGAFAFAVLGGRFRPEDTLAFLLFGLWFATLVVGFAIDLDQRLLPDELTLPVVPIALVFDLVGANPLVGHEVLPAVAVAVVVPAALFLLSIPFGAGAFGLGDVKLLLGVGLMAGSLGATTGLLAGLLTAGLVLAVLLGARRIGRRTYIPFGPFLIFGAVWGIFVTT